MNREKKEKFRSVRGSLASRILLIALIFLVIPLVTLISLLYMDDLRVKQKNNYFTLKVLMDQKVGMVSGIISHEMSLLSDLSYLLPKLETPQKDLDELARRDGVEALFQVQRGEDGRYLCTLASKESLKGKDFTDLVEQAKKGTVFLVDPKVPTFYLTRYSPRTDTAWVTVFLLNHLTQNFPIEKDVIYPASTSLIDQEGLVVASTDHRLKGVTFTHPVPKKYPIDGQTHISIERHVPDTNFALLISAPEAINFVDIPNFFLKVTLAAAIIAVLGGGGALILTKKLAKPLRKLTQLMKQVGRGDLKSRFTPVPMGFEINDLGEILNDTMDSLNTHIEAAHKERLERETYEQELKIGEEVQSSILPKQVPDFPNLEMAARFIAAKEVGGDFYDFLSNGQLMISIADTSGKGISACLYSLSVRSMLRSYGEIHHSLDQIIRETNNLFCHDTGDTGVFVTAFIAFFDPKTYRFHYSNCGHFPTYLQKKDGTIQTLTTPGMALGVVPFDTVATNEVQLEPGDLLLLFTDGVVEAHNSHNELFGEERLLSSFKSKKNLHPEEIVDQLIEELALFAEGTPQHDDLTLLVVKVT